MNPVKHSSEELTQEIYLTLPIAHKDKRGAVCYTYDEQTRKGPIRASVEAYGAYIMHGQALEADKLQYRIILRYRSWIDRKTQVTWRGRKLVQTIAPMDINGNQQWLQLTCEEAV